MSGKQTKTLLAEAFASGTLNSLREFWFSHLQDEMCIVVPDAQDIDVWFVDKSDEFDDLCRAKFGSILGTVFSQQASAKDILAAANPNSALDWMGLIVLLDQMPRNCYRGMEATKVFNFFDSRALMIAMEAKELAIHLHPEVRYKMGYRLWLFMPMEHAEDMDSQELMVKEQRNRFHDLDSLMKETIEVSGEDMKLCREILTSKREELNTLKKIMQKAVDEHYDAIKQFGRFPYRNVVLGRVSTQEELAFLDSM